MKTPKEKAEEIYLKISKTIASIPMFEQDRKRVIKENANLQVDEIIEVSNYVEECVGDWENEIEYWQKVKQHLNNI